MVRVTAEGAWGAYEDLVLLGRATTTEIAHYLLVLGGLTWATGQFAAYTAYAHRRPLAAVVLPGTILIVNVSITVLDQFAVLVLFTVAALLFLVRFHVADEQRTWARHRIADVGNAVGLSLRAGLSFVGVALLGSLVLTNVASSAPLAGWWQGLDQRLIDFGSELARFFPSGGPGTSFGGASFGAAVTVEGVWTSDDTPVLSITGSPDVPQLKWRAVTYDRLVGNQWSRSDTVDVDVPARQDLLAGTGDAPVEKVATREVKYVVRSASGVARRARRPRPGHGRPGRPADPRPEGKRDVVRGGPGRRRRAIRRGRPDSHRHRWRRRRPDGEPPAGGRVRLPGRPAGGLPRPPGGNGRGGRPGDSSGRSSKRLAPPTRTTRRARSSPTSPIPATSPTTPMSSTWTAGSGASPIASPSRGAATASTSPRPWS